MNIPKRWQRSRERGAKQPMNTKYVGRPTIYGNPFLMEYDSLIGYMDEERYRVVCLYSQELDVVIANLGMTEEEFFEPLLKYGYLSCFCPIDKQCHVDILIERLEMYVEYKTNFHQVPMHFPPTFIPKQKNRRVKVKP